MSERFEDLQAEAKARTEPSTSEEILSLLDRVASAAEDGDEAARRATMAVTFMVLAASMFAKAIRQACEQGAGLHLGNHNMKVAIAAAISCAVDEAIVHMDWPELDLDVIDCLTKVRNNPHAIAKRDADRTSIAAEIDAEINKLKAGKPEPVDFNLPSDDVN